MGEGGCLPPVTLPDKRAFLEGGAPWPDEPPPDCIETHASLVFLTRDRAWKLKKPVRLVHVDQRALAARERLCREEVRLNRELSGNVYRGLVPLVQHPDGALALGGEGHVVDWLIETVRLPAAAMLDRRLAVGPAPGVAEIDALCDVLLAFYRRRAPAPMDGGAFYRRVLKETGIATKHLREMAAAADIQVSAHVLDRAARAVSGCRREMLRRARAGLLIEGHGDLRAEHVCLIEPPVIFDRLEIDSALRRVDPYFELHALGVECRLLGGGWIGGHLLDRLAGAFPPPSDQLLSVYGLVACLTRARFAVDHFRDRIVPTPEKYRARTLAYLAAAGETIDAAPTG